MHGSIRPSGQRLEHQASEPFTRAPIEQQLSQLTLNPSSSCFVPSAKPFVPKEKTSMVNSPGLSAKGEPSEDDESLKSKDGYHRGRYKWGKYKKIE